jgi:hypothetical protein
MRMVFVLGGLAGILCGGAGEARGAERPFILDCQQVVGTASRGESRELLCRQVNTPPRVDGRLDDPCWKKAARPIPFVADDLSSNVPHQTETYYLYNEKNVYFGVRAHVSVPHRFRTDKRSPWTGECVETFWDSNFDRKSHHQFVIGAAGDLFQTALTESGLNMDWKGPWTAKTAMEAKAWTAEAEIPLATLGFRGPLAGKTWGHMVTRLDSESKRHSFLSVPYGAKSAHEPWAYGFLYFEPKSGVAPVLPVEIRFRPGLPPGGQDTQVA